MLRKPHFLLVLDVVFLSADQCQHQTFLLSASTVTSTRMSVVCFLKCSSCLTWKFRRILRRIIPTGKWMASSCIPLKRSVWLSVQTTLHYHNSFVRKENQQPMRHALWDPPPPLYTPRPFPHTGVPSLPRRALQDVKIFGQSGPTKMSRITPPQNTDGRVVSTLTSALSICF